MDAAGHVREALKLLGLTSEKLPTPELDLGNTPERIVRMWRELTQSVGKEPPFVSVFETEHTSMLTLTGISFVSLCSHHFAPFRGTVDIGYLPKSKLVGISKPARIVNYFAACPQTQELLTSQIADYLTEKLEPEGVMVVVRAEHTCVSCRGVCKPGAMFITSEVRGVFLEDLRIKSEFLQLIGAR